jgi:predicted transcriptional regulator of viral defense system
MLYTFEEAIKKTGNVRKLQVFLKSGKIRKIRKGLYSDAPINNELNVFLKGHPKSIFTAESAYYFLGLADEVPAKNYIATPHNSTRHHEINLVEYLESKKTFGLGRTTVVYGKAVIPVYSLTRMLVETAKHRKRLPFDYYREIVLSFRDRKDEVDPDLLEEILSVSKHSDALLRIIQTEIL